MKITLQRNAGGEDGRRLAACLFLLFVSMSSLRADSVVGNMIDWDTPESSGSFSSTYGTAVIDYPSDGGNTSGWMRLTFTNTTEFPLSNWYDVVTIKATNLYAGSWTTQMWVEFDFWASNTVPGSLQVRWQSTTNDYVWRQTVTPPPVGVWDSAGAGFNSWSSWQYPGATESQYLADLQTIDWVGIYIFRNTVSEQIYGVDNFRLMIPEPAEIIMLAAVALSSGMSRRRKRRRREAQ